jgi:hypothetical protein
MTVPPSSDPPILYHYTNAAGLKGILDSKCLWATDLRFLNDVAEYRLTVDAVCTLADAHAQYGPRATDDAFQRGLRTISRFPQPMFATSLSTKGDVLSQWRAYCPSGGYALGFDFARLQAQATKLGFEFARVDYSPITKDPETLEQVIATHRAIHLALGMTGEPQAQPGQRFAVPGQSSIAPERAAELIRPLAEWIDRKAPWFKHHSFEDEDEWRLVRRGVRPELLKTRVRGDQFVPYVEFPLAGPDEQLPITRIVVSPPTTELAMIGLRAALESAPDRAPPMVDVVPSGSPFRRL